MNNREYTQKFLSLLKEGALTRKVDLSTGYEALSRSGETLLSVFEKGSEEIEETIRLKPRLVLFGAGHVAKAVYDIACMLGISVTTIDERKEMNSEKRFPLAERILLEPEPFFKTEREFYNPYYCIFTHGHKGDRAALSGCLKRKSEYIGMIGSKGKIAKTYELLKEEEGFDDEDFERVHAPIGLKIGGDSPEEIAVSVIAEIISIYSKTKHSSTLELEYLLERAKHDKGVSCRIIEKAGSSPREVGTEMFVTADKVVGTIGGGALEATVIKDARSLKENCVREYNLASGGKLDMICGGDVKVLFQLFD